MTYTDSAASRGPKSHSHTHIHTHISHLSSFLYDLVGLTQSDDVVIVTRCSQAKITTFFFCKSWWLAGCSGWFLGDYLFRPRALDGLGKTFKSDYLEKQKAQHSSNKPHDLRATHRFE